MLVMEMISVLPNDLYLFSGESSNVRQGTFFQKVAKFGSRRSSIYTFPTC